MCDTLRGQKFLPAIGGSHFEKDRTNNGPTPHQRSLLPPHWTMFVRLLTALAVTLCASTVAAQDYTMLVAVGENSGLTPQEHEDIVEESAYLVEDFGGFAVTRWYQLPSDVVLDDCGANASCYVDRLFASEYDYVLVVSAYDTGTEIEVGYQTIDTQVGILAAEEMAVLPQATDFAYLMAPCHEALKVTPAWIAPIAVAPVPPTTTPVTTTPVTTTPVTTPNYEFPELDEPRMGQLGRIGAGTAAGGGALFLGGVLMGFSADDTQQEIQSEPHTRTRLEELQRKGESQQTVANVLMIGGGVVLATGITLLIIDHLGQDDDASLSVGTSGTRLWMRATF